MSDNKMPLIQQLMLDFSEAVMSDDKKLANQLRKDIEKLKLSGETDSFTPPKPTRKPGVKKTAGEASKAEKTPTSRKKTSGIPGSRKQVIVKKEEKTITESESSYIAPTRTSDSVTPQTQSGKGVMAQWRQAGGKPIENKYVDPGTDDLPPKHKKIDKKMAKAKRESETRDPVEKVRAICYVCSNEVMVYPSELERVSDDERVTRTNKIRCNRCTSMR